MNESCFRRQCEIEECMQSAARLIIDQIIDNIISTLIEKLDGNTSAH